MLARTIVWFAFLAVAGWAAEPVAWRRWEVRVPASGVELETAEFVQNGTSWRTPVYRDGSKWVARTAFPETGRARWKVGTISGEVVVRADQSGNPLYRHGFLRISGNGRYLEHADGTPFLWMGDTAWYGAIKAKRGEWAAYLKDRRAKGFSVVHVSAVRGPQGWAEEPFGPDGSLDANYWRRIEARIREANEAGLVVFLVGLGRPSNERWLDVVARDETVREIAARLSGDHVVVSPNFDGAYRELYDEVGVRVRRYLPRHLVTQHPNTAAGQNEIYHGKAYVDFDALQSGHHGGRLEAVYRAAREWTLNLRAMVPVKPVLNVEAMYDGRGSDEGKAWREGDARRLGWISWFSGALGYSYGAGETARKVPGTNGGIWSWNQRRGNWDRWDRVMRWRSSEQMKVLRDFLAGVEWWRLEPVVRADVDPVRGVVEARIGEDERYFYSPMGEAIGIPAGDWQGEWVDPKTGKRLEANLSEKTSCPTSAEDWVLRLRRGR